jgi:flagellin
MTVDKLSSGDRLKKLGTDSAGLSVSSMQKSAVRSVKVAAQNIEQGMSLIETMNGSLSSMRDLLIRAR